MSYSEQARREMRLANRALSKTAVFEVLANRDENAHPNTQDTNLDLLEVTKEKEMTAIEGRVTTKEEDISAQVQSQDHSLSKQQESLCRPPIQPLTPITTPLIHSPPRSSPISTGPKKQHVATPMPGSRADKEARRSVYDVYEKRPSAMAAVGVRTLFEDKDKEELRETVRGGVSAEERARQWEEEVDELVKLRGSSIDQEALRRVREEERLIRHVRRRSSSSSSSSSLSFNSALAVLSTAKSNPNPNPNPNSYEGNPDSAPKQSATLQAKTLPTPPPPQRRPPAPPSGEKEKRVSVGKAVTLVAEAMRPTTTMTTTTTTTTTTSPSGSSGFKVRKTGHNNNSNNGESSLDSLSDRDQDRVVEERDRHKERVKSPAAAFTPPSPPPIMKPPTPPRPPVTPL